MHNKILSISITVTVNQRKTQKLRTLWCYSPFLLRDTQPQMIDTNPSICIFMSTGIDGEHHGIDTKLDPP